MPQPTAQYVVFRIRPNSFSLEFSESYSHLVIGKPVDLTLSHTDNID